MSRKLDMHRMTTGCLLAVLAAATARGAVEDVPLVIGTEVRELAVVRTRAELEKQPAIQNRTGEKVRLGLEASEGPQGSCLLIYCLREQEEGWEEGRPVQRAWGFEPLGPVLFKVFRENEKKGNDGAWGHQQLLGWDKIALFAAPIKLDRPGKLVVEVQGEDGIPLAKGVVTVREEAREGGEGWYGWKVTDRFAEPVVVTLDERRGVPQWDGAQPMAWEKAGEGKGQAGGERGGAAKLVTCVPTEADGRLKLTVEKGVLQLRSEADLFEGTERYFLTRWWVNGKPVSVKASIEPDKEGQGVRFLREEVRKIREAPATVSWQVGGALAAAWAKPGDKVGVQVLYCRNGWEAAPGVSKMTIRQKLGEGDGASPVLLSNKVEWTVGAGEAASGPATREKGD